MTWTELTRIPRRLTLMIGGEALQSGFHFALNLALVSMLSARDFGAFAIVLVIGGLSLTYIRALAGMPASIWIGRSRRQAAANAYDVTFGSGALLLSVISAIGVYLLLRTWLDKGALAGGCFVGLWSARSYLRTAYFARGRRKAVILADFVFVLSGALSASTLWIGGVDVLQMAFVVLAVANAVGIAAMLLLAGWPLRVSYGSQMRRRYAGLWRPLGWSGLSATLTNLQGQTVALLVTGFGGPAAYAPIAATLLLFVPLRIAAASLVNLLQPEISAELAHGRARKVWFQLKLWFGISGVVALVYGAAMIAILPRIHLHVLEGVPILVTGFLAWAIYTATMLNVAPRVVLEVMSAFGTVALITGTAAAIGAAVIIFLLFIAPPVWALAGGALSEAVVLAATGTVAYRKLQSAMATKEKADPDLARRLHPSAALGVAPAQGQGPEEASSAALRTSPAARRLPVQEECAPRAFQARLHTDLVSAKTVWRRLEREGKCTAFQRYDWISTVVRHLSRSEAEVLVVEVVDVATGQPAMLLPLIRRRCFGYRVINWLNCDVCDYSAPVFASDWEWRATDAAAAWAAARRVLPPADLLRVDGMPGDVSGVANPLVMLSQTRLSVQTTCGFPITGDPERVLERCCSAAFVRSLKKSGRRLARKGPVHFIEAQTKVEVDEIFAVLLEQRRQRFRRLGRFDLVNQPSITAFYRDAAMQGLNGGPVRLHGLRVGDTWVGTTYGLVYDGAYQGLLITIAGDPWRHYSLGMHVHAEAVKWARRQDLDYFDMSIGGGAFKDDSGGHRLPLFAIEEALTGRGRFIFLALRTGAAVKAWLEQRPWVFEPLRRARRKLRQVSTKLGDLLPNATKP